MNHQETDAYRVQIAHIQAILVDVVMIANITLF